MWRKNGIGRGDPLSIILYLFYNGDLLDVAKAERGEIPNAWVDDTAFFRVVDNMKQGVQAMTNIMTRTGGGSGMV
jgi:hypothetical protein